MRYGKFATNRAQQVNERFRHDRWLGKDRVTEVEFNTAKPFYPCSFRPGKRFKVRQKLT